MTIMELGALGELLGAIGVIATLIYLSVQVRQNTRAMEESRRLALAQTYQMRADALQEMLVTAAQSEIGAIIVKLTQAGYPKDISALDKLDPAGRSATGVYLWWPPVRRMGPHRRHEASASAVNSNVVSYTIAPIPAARRTTQ